MLKSSILIWLLGTAALLVSTSTSDGFPTYSRERGVNNCRTCHGDFRAEVYTSKKDGQVWGNLHDLHRQKMLAGDCLTCHRGMTSELRYPVFLGQSGGGRGLAPLSCVGCHGRAEDAGHDSRSAGRGAGLRQHHTNAGVGVCQNCHSDANPALYTPVPESVAPPYYFTPDENHPQKPTNACSPFGEEDFAGDVFGLDNDGDGLYDVVDRDCMPPFGDVEICHAVDPTSDADPASHRTISVNGAALGTHLGHGDTVGACDSGQTATSETPIPGGITAEDGRVNGPITRASIPPMALLPSRGRMHSGRRVSRVRRS